MLAGVRAAARAGRRAAAAGRGGHAGGGSAGLRRARLPLLQEKHSVPHGAGPAAADL